MRKLLSIFGIFISIFSTRLYSQITIGNIEKKEEEKIVSRPEPYDSLQNFQVQENLIDYKKYIGLQFYLPPFSNPQLGVYPYRPCNFLFATHPSKIKAENVMKGSSELIKPSYDNIITSIYAPFHYYSGQNGTGGHMACITSNANELSGIYFTVLDVLYGDKKDVLNKSMYAKFDKLKGENDSKTTFFENLFQEIQCHGDNGYRGITFFLMRNEKTGDSLYCSKINHFILVPYFVKQKGLFENQNIVSYTDEYQKKDIVTNANITIEKNGKWLCKEVTLLNKNKVYSSGKDEYAIFYVLKNSKGETIALEKLQNDQDNDNFVLERDFIKAEEEKKLKREELLAKQKQEEIERKANEKALEEKRKALHEKYKAECIAKFGQYNGELIASGKVKIGMTLEMCKASWGKPFWVNKTTDQYGVFENYYYGFARSLHFVNGVLKRIEE